jgi:hypothetical protein
VPAEGERRVFAGEQRGLPRAALWNAGNVEGGIEWKGDRARAGDLGLIERGDAPIEKSAQRGQARDEKRIPRRVVGTDADAVQEEENDARGFRGPS